MDSKRDRREDSDGHDEGRHMSIKELDDKYGRNPAPFEKKGTCKRCHRKGHHVRTCTKKPYDKTDEESSNLAIASSQYVFSASARDSDYSSQEAEFVHVYADSGCTRHMISHISTSQLGNPRLVNIPIQTFSGEIQSKISGDYGLMKNLLVVPGSSGNLLSISQLCDDGCICVFNKEELNVYASRIDLNEDKQPILCGKRVGGLYEVKIYRHYVMNQSSLRASVCIPLSKSATSDSECCSCSRSGFQSSTLVNVEHMILSDENFAN